MYVRHWFMYVPERSQAEELSGSAPCREAVRRFVDWISLAMARGTRLASDVLKDEALRPSNHRPRPASRHTGTPDEPRFLERSGQPVLPAEDGPGPTAASSPRPG